MPTHTFPCPFCGKKMGVGIELLGKKVRCPHCTQILVAPAPVATPVVVQPPVAIPVVVPPPPPPPVVVVAPPPPPPPPVVVVAPPPPPPPVQHSDLPVFNIPSQEARESIFGEHQDEGDDVFSSAEGTKLQVPDLPPIEPESAPLEVMPEPVPVVQPTKGPDPAYEPTVEMNSPFTGLEASPLPLPPPPVVVQPVPVVVPIPAPPPPPVPMVAPIGATPPSSPGTNPWAGMDDVPVVQAAVPTLVPVPVPTLVPVPAPAAESESPFSTTTDEPRPKKKKRDRDQDDDDRDEDRPAKPKSRAAKPAAGSGSPLIKIGFFLLLPYAFIVTVLAIYGLLFKSSTPAGHPLSNLPDNFGEFTPAERKKTGKLSPAAMEGDLPPDLRVALGSGNKLDIGQLEIEPLAVEVRNLKITTEGKNSKDPPQISPSPAIVLRMKIKNTSDDLLIHPLDPAFNRKPVGNDHGGTGLIVGKQNIWGGAISWPFKANVIRSFEAAQEGDFTPLKPGETRDYVVFTDASNRVVKSVREAKDTLLWRVQVRRGRIEFDGKDIPVTAIIGVEFKASDVKEPD